MAFQSFAIDTAVFHTYFEPVGHSFNSTLCSWSMSVQSTIPIPFAPEFSFTLRMQPLKFSRIIIVRLGADSIEEIFYNINWTQIILNLTWQSADVQSRLCLKLSNVAICCIGHDKRLIIYPNSDLLSIIKGRNVVPFIITERKFRCGLSLGSEGFAISKITRHYDLKQIELD